MYGYDVCIFLPYTRPSTIVVIGPSRKGWAKKREGVSDMGPRYMFALGCLKLYNQKGSDPPLEFYVSPILNPQVFIYII